MSGEPVDRRGLFRDLFRQATDAIVPALEDRFAPLIGDPEPGPASVRRTATPEELQSAAADFGLQAHGEEIARLAGRSLQLLPAVHGGHGPVSFGGRPLFEEGVEWPAWQGRPLTFLAELEAGEPWGRLLFFYDAVGRPSGCLAAHRGSARVLSADGRLTPADGPALPELAVPGHVAVELVLPPARSGEVESLALSPPEREAWEALREELASMQGAQLADRAGAPFRAVHRVFGYPHADAIEMALTCELTTAGEDVIEGRARLHARAPELAPRAARWQLLAQFSGDGKLSWPWVAQRIYFWVDRDALARGELEQVWAIAR